MARANATTTEIASLMNTTHDPSLSTEPLGDVGLSGTNFWCLWTILFVGLICILICCFLKFNQDEPQTRPRGGQTRNGRSYVATDQYPGPPIDGEARQLGSTRLPSYNRAVRHQSRNCRTPPPEYKHNHYPGPSSFLDSVKSVITDSFMSWYSNDNDDDVPTYPTLCDSRTERLDEIQEEECPENSKQNAYKIV